MQQRSIEAAAEFERAIAAAKRDGPPPNVDPRVHVAMIEAMRGELAVLREQLDDSSVRPQRLAGHESRSGSRDP